MQYVGNYECFTLQRHAATCHRAVSLMCVCVRNYLRCNPVTRLSFSYVLLFYLLWFKLNSCYLALASAQVCCVSVLQEMWLVEYVNSYKKLVKLQCAKYRVVCVLECVVAACNSIVILGNITEGFSQCFYGSYIVRLFPLFVSVGTSVNILRNRDQLLLVFGSCRHEWCVSSHLVFGLSFIQHHHLHLDLRIVRKT
jgi:hypothetical protein